MPITFDNRLQNLSNWIEDFIGTISERETDDDVRVSIVHLSGEKHTLIVRYEDDVYNVTITKEPDITVKDK